MGETIDQSRKESKITNSLFGVLYVPTSSSISEFRMSERKRERELNGFTLYVVL